MNQERDLLPWILGGLSTAAVALAIVAVSNHHAVTPSPAMPVIAAPPRPSAAPAPALPPVAARPAADTSAAAAPPNAAPLLSPQPEIASGQIWTCMTKGVKTFSNNPCGEGSTLLEVGPVNTMSSVAPVRYARAYPAPPQYSVAPQPAPTYDDDTDQGGDENGGDSYAVVQGVAVLPRRRHEHHPHRPPYQHHPTSMPRKF